MVNRPAGFKALLLTAGAAALLTCAPLAGAEPPPTECAPTDQQCQDQQNQGAGVADQVIGNVKQGVQQAQQAGQSMVDPKTGKPYPFGQFHHIILNGAETCWPVGEGIVPPNTYTLFPGDPDGFC
jgi:hypothetical protein